MSDENGSAKKYEDDNLEEVIDGQITKLEELNVATVLIKGKQNVKEELQRVQAEVLKLSSSIIGIKNIVKTISLQNKRSIELLKLLGDLNKKILHQEKNVPHELIQGFQNATVSPNMLKCSVNPMKAQVPNSAKNAKVLAKSEMTTDCKRILFNEPEICPTIPFIMTEEFNYLPKYMRGRQTIDTFNAFISAINQTLIAKYTILSLGKAAAQKKGEMNLYLYYKNQECDTRTEDGYLYFFTAEDFYRQTNTKIDKTKLNLLTALRHCKRLRERRIKNEIQYIITPH